LAQRVDVSSSGSSGRYAYYIKELLSLMESDNVSQIISNCNKANKCILVLAKSLDKWEHTIGEPYQPIRIIAKFYDKSFNIHEVSFTFTKCTLIKEVKEEISQLLLIELNVENEVPILFESLVFNLVASNNKKKSNRHHDKLLLESSLYDHKSLDDLSVDNEDLITIETTQTAQIDDESCFFQVKEKANDCEDETKINVKI
jgi:hypothetical protein